MAQTSGVHPDFEAVIRSWRDRAPWGRRILARIGLPGKLILCIVLLLFIGRVASCWFIVRQSRDILDRVTADYSNQLAAIDPAARKTITDHARAEIDVAMRWTQIEVVTCNALAMIMAIPIILLLVHRIFEPIRRLVAATDKIAAGELDTQVAIHRPDSIGMLARSFNLMARRVQAQQTDLENANRQLSYTNHSLEQAVQQRTTDLQKANKQLALEVCGKEELLRAVSHDLSGPLRNISGMAAMLLHKNRQCFDAEVIHRLERILKNVEVESDLIGELVGLSKIRSSPRKIQDVDLNDLLADVAGVFEEDLQNHGIDLLIEFPLPVLNCERRRLRQLFQNLLDNAIKYMGAGARDSADALPRKQIRIGCITHSEDVEFYVTDTGMGIEEQDREAIFNVFRRGSSAAVRKIAGKGVGLSSAKSIVETYHGRLWVESTVGQGSTFRFTVDRRHVVVMPRLAGAA